MVSQIHNFNSTCSDLALSQSEDAPTSFERGKKKKIDQKIEKINEKVEKIREEKPEKVDLYLEAVGGFTGNNHTKDSWASVA